MHRAALRSAAALLLAVAAAFAAMAVPLDHQVSILKKVLQFDNTLAGQSPVRLLVVHGGDERGGRAVADTFRGAGFDVAEAAAVGLENALGERRVVYFCEDALDAAARAGAGVLTLCGTQAAVEANQVAIGVGLLDGKPKLLVSLAAYTACGHDISSQVLGLAKIYR